MNDSNIVISLKNISKTFHIRDANTMTIREKAFNAFKKTHKRKIEALKNINLEIKKGEFFGIIGHNGSGKSTLLHIISGGYPADKGGHVKIEGKFMRLSLGLGFDPELTARENIYVNGSILGLTFKKIGEKFNEIIEFSELQNFVDTKVKYYSSGMKSRLMFSIAVHAEADIFLMDEFFGGVGDEKFRKKSEKVFEESVIKGRTIIHVSHSLGTIKKHCDRVLVLNKGEAVFIGSPDEAIEIYKNLQSK